MEVLRCYALSLSPGVLFYGGEYGAVLLACEAYLSRNCSRLECKLYTSSNYLWWQNYDQGWSGWHQRTMCIPKEYMNNHTIVYHQSNPWKHFLSVCPLLFPVQNCIVSSGYALQEWSLVCVAIYSKQLHRECENRDSLAGSECISSQWPRQGACQGFLGHKPQQARIHKQDDQPSGSHFTRQKWDCSNRSNSWWWFGINMTSVKPIFKSWNLIIAPGKILS